MTKTRKASVPSEVLAKKVWFAHPSIREWWLRSDRLRCAYIRYWINVPFAIFIESIALDNEVLDYEILEV